LVVVVVVGIGSRRLGIAKAIKRGVMYAGWRPNVRLMALTGWGLRRHQSRAMSDRVT